MTEVRDVHELLTFRSQTITPTNTQASDLLEVMSSDIQNVSGAWSPKLLQATFEAELGNAIQVCFAKALQSQREQPSPIQAPTEQSVVANSSLSLIRKKVKRRTLTASTTQTILGEVRCFLASCEVVEGPDVELDGTESSSRETKETTSNFVFVPASWLLRLGISKGVRFQRMWSNTRCWQATIRTFRVSSLHLHVKYTPRTGEINGT